MQQSKQSKKELMYSKIEKHGANLNAIFNTKFDNITLCKKLLRIEKKANFAATCLCNTNTLNLLELNKFTGYDVKQATEQEQDKFFANIEKQVLKIIGESFNDALYINLDPRGYTLKLKKDFISKNIFNWYDNNGDFVQSFNNEEEAINITSKIGGKYTKENKSIFTDFGGYGILAPDFSN